MQNSIQERSAWVTRGLLMILVVVALALAGLGIIVAIVVDAAR
jgi:hypothetical protein